MSERSGLPLDFRIDPDYEPPSERVRIARICTKCKTRTFGKPEWECGEHPGSTVTQENRPYFGQSTKEGRVDGAP